MTRPVAVLRPEPGNAATIERLRAAGLETIALPLFAVRPLAWGPIDPAGYDGLLVTSANTLHHGGDMLGQMRGLPVLTVGATTAGAARAAGFDVVASGERDAAAILEIARARGFARLLHLGGRERSIDAGGIVATAAAVYANEVVAVSNTQLTRLGGTVTLLHSARAARRLGALLDDAGIERSAIRVVAISDAVHAAAGPGWQHTATADHPTDAALIAAARTLLD